jgi:hypothetical protein
MTPKLVILAIILLQAILAALAKRAAEKKKREAEEARRQRGGTFSAEDDADEEEEDDEEDADAASRPKSAGRPLGDIFDIFKDEGAVRPEPPPPLGSPQSRTGSSTPQPTTQSGHPAVRAPFPGMRIPRGLEGQTRSVPAPVAPPPGTPTQRRPDLRHASDAATRDGKPAPSRLAQSERSRESARRAAEREASRRARQEARNRGKEATRSRGAVADRYAGRKGAGRSGPVAPGSAGKRSGQTTPTVALPAAAAQVRAVLGDPTRVRTAFVVSEMLRRPDA